MTSRNKPAFSYKKLISLISKDQAQEIINICRKIHPTDLALLFYNLDLEDQKKLISILKDSLNPEAIPWFDANLLHMLLESIGYHNFAKAISHLDIVKMIQIMILLQEDVMDKITLEFNQETRDAVKNRFKYPEKTLGRIMSTDYAPIPMWWTLKDVNNFFSLNNNLKSCNAILVIDENHRPVGTIHSTKALGCKPFVEMKDIMDKIEVFDENTPVIEAILAFKKYGLSHSCIVDKNSKLIGYINFTQVLNALEEETEEEAFQLHGIIYDSINDHGVNLTNSVAVNIKSRIPWILVNLLVAFIVANIVVNFENIISHYIYAASLMSVVASSAGSSGAQTVAVTVRLISKMQVRSIKAYIIIISEFLTGLTNGLIIGTISFLVSYYMYNNIKMSSIFGLAILCNFMIAGIIGSLTPVILEKANLDPASGSNIIVSAITDIFGFFVFLYMINWMHQFV